MTADQTNLGSGSWYALASAICAAAGFMWPLSGGYLAAPAAIALAFFAIRRRAKLAGGLAMLAGVLSTLFVLGNHVERRPAATQLSAPSWSEIEQAGRVRLSHYERVQTGMTKAEIDKLVGKAGVELSRTEFAGSTVAIYSWANSDGTNMTITFENGRAISKGQLGLR